MKSLIYVTGCLLLSLLAGVAHAKGEKKPMDCLELREVAQTWTKTINIYRDIRHEGRNNMSSGCVGKGLMVYWRYTNYTNQNQSQTGVSYVGGNGNWTYLGSHQEGDIRSKFEVYGAGFW